MRKLDSSHRLNNWYIDFKGNVHMYAHRLVLTRGDRFYDVACEDTPDGYIGIWLYETEMEPEIAAEAQSVLAEWTRLCGFSCKIFISTSTSITIP